MNGNRICGTVFALLIFALATPAGASIMYNTAAPFSGSRSVATPGLFTTEPDWQDALLEWSIVDNGDMTYTYDLLPKN